MDVTVFVPGNFPPTTGAIVYATHLTEALRGLGQCVEVSPVGGQHPLPDEAAHAAAASLWARHTAPGATLVIDGFCLAAFAELDVTRAIGLIHHPMSAEPGLLEETRAGFAAAEARLLPRLSRILVPSADVAARLTPLNARVDVLAPGMADVGRSAGSGGPACHLLAVGSLIPRKGHETVLRALTGLPDLDWRLTISGDSSIDPDHAVFLRNLAETCGIAARVTFAGPCGGEVMEGLWRSADLFVSGSVYEGYGMAVAEAVRRGIPLAVTEGAAASDVIPLTCSAVVAPGDHVQLSKALRRLIFSDRLRHDLSGAAWTAGQALPNWADQARRFMELVGSNGG